MQSGNIVGHAKCLHHLDEVVALNATKVLPEWKHLGSRGMANNSIPLFKPLNSWLLSPIYFFFLYRESSRLASFSSGGFVLSVPKPPWSRSLTCFQDTAIFLWDELFWSRGIVFSTFLSEVLKVRVLKPRKFKSKSNICWFISFKEVQTSWPVIEQVSFKNERFWLKNPWDIQFSSSRGFLMKYGRIELILPFVLPFLPWASVNEFRSPPDIHWKSLFSSLDRGRKFQHVGFMMVRIGPHDD